MTPSKAATSKPKGQPQFVSNTMGHSGAMGHHFRLKQLHANFKP